MQKTILIAVAGAGLLLAGCKATDHRYQMIPVDDPSAGQNVAMNRPMANPQNNYIPDSNNYYRTDVNKPTSKPHYAPMKDVRSDGGFDDISERNTSKNPASSGKSTTHIVRKGEFPGSIAQKYGIKVKALMDANNMTEADAKKLRVGQKLVIPGGKTVKNTDKKNDRKSIDNSQPDPGKGKHRVRKGEFPGSIAQKYGIKVKALLDANKMTEADAKRLRIGQVLIIPDGKNPVPAPAPIPGIINPAPVPGPNPAPIVDPDLISRDFLDVTEDTDYSSVATKYGVSEELLRSINGNPTQSFIPRGSVILVPQK